MSDTIKKIIGHIEPVSHEYLEQSGMSITFFEGASFLDVKTPALLLVSTDDKMPEVMTMDQVRAMLADLKDQTMSMAVEQSIDRIAAKHGITP